ncbi:hypothetical protein ACI1MP_37285 (plasmid) [Kitasatospora griseola]|uniref:hypothetical protein n=1 Tax=Kitasatospora griseola TaxID=2064 RepID=UPI003855E9FE
MIMIDPHPAGPVPDVLPDPWAVLRGTKWPALETAYGAGVKLPRVLVRLLDEDLAVSDAREALGGLEPVRHQNSIYGATPATALFVAALLARRALCRPGAADGVGALLLGWLADLALDFDDACVAVGDRHFDGRYLDGYPAMVAVRALRPVLHQAVAPFLDDPDAAVRDTALAAALALAEHPALAPHRDDLAARARRLLLAGDVRWRRQQALDTLTAWGHDTTGLTRPGDDDRSPFTTDPPAPGWFLDSPPF